jgi:hypothetical protein
MKVQCELDPEVDDDPLSPDQSKVKQKA